MYLKSKRPLGSVAIAVAVTVAFAVTVTVGIAIAIAWSLLLSRRFYYFTPFQQPWGSKIIYALLTADDATRQSQARFKMVRTRSRTRIRIVAGRECGQRIL